MLKSTTLKRGVSRYIPCISNLISDLSDNGLYYVNGPETLPPPLPQEREAELMEMLEDHREEVSGELIEHNLRLVVYIAKKFENTGVYIEDLVSIGTIGLIKAVNTFSPSKNIKLATYASRCIENEILMYLRKKANSNQTVSFEDPLNTDGDGNELLLSDVLGSREDSIMEYVESVSEIAALNKAVNALPPRERQITSLRYGLNGKREYTQKEVADALNISQSYVSRLEKKILGKLKRELENAF